MPETPRKKSPRAPSIPLNEAIDGALKIYEKEHRHAAPTEAVAQHLGYKGANNGAALKFIASIRYYGLLDRPADGQLAVTKDFESYHFAPSPEIRRELLNRWLKTPPVFAELLDRFPDALPSDKTLRYELIQRGFLPDAVDSVVSVFQASVSFVHYYYSPPVAAAGDTMSSAEPQANAEHPTSELKHDVAAVSDRIPIRLPGGRRAFVEIPFPFYATDKERIKKQIDLLLTEEDEAAVSSAATRPSVD